MNPTTAFPDADIGAVLSERLEVQPDSPVFARLADRYLDAGMPASALALLQEGMRHHPDYATAYVVAARALIMQRHYTEARSMLEHVERLQPDSPAARQLAESIPQLESSHPPDTRALPRNESTSTVQQVAPRGGRKKARFSSQQDLIAGSDALFGIPPAPQPVPQPADADAAPLPDEASAPSPMPVEAQEQTELERLARALEFARMPALDANDVFQDEREEAPPLPDVVDVHARPVTETLAEIYVRQGRIEEAIETYLTLCVRHPDRREKFISRIADLQQSAPGTPSPDA